MWAQVLRRTAGLALATTGLVVPGAQAASSAASKNVQVELLSETDWVQPGQPVWLGVRLRMAPGWHTYWINPGDSGLPTRMKWALPPGFEGGAFVWPTPEAIAAPPLMSYGYEGEVLLLAQVSTPARIDAASVVLGGRLDWLECKEACLPGRAQLDVTLPVNDVSPVPSAARRALFEEARRRLPGDGAAWSPRVRRGPRLLTLSFRAPQAPRRALFFPETQQAIEHSQPQRLLRAAEDYRLELAPAANAEPVGTLAGVLLVEGDSGRQAVRIAGAVEPDSGTAGTATLLDDGRAFVTPAAAGAAGAAAAQAAPARAGGQGLATLWALGAAFLGGLILNLMPCVLPVLSLKVMSFVRHAGGDPRAAWRHGLAYTAGVLVSFWALAGLLLALRAAGHQVGWGFQLQSPGFVVFLACLFFVIGLNLFGVFEVGLGFTTVGSGLQQRSGLGAAFGGGALATLVATPCTAPFMGSALGFGLSQPAIVSLAIFTALGLGMALPYLVLAWSPRLARFVPRPGRWMETFKQFMGFLMMATVVGLAWVLGRQTSTDGVTALLAALVALALAAWIYGRGSAPEASGRQRAWAYALSAAAVAGGTFLAWAHAATPATVQERGPLVQGSIRWEEWSPQRVEQALAQGRPVFIDFTAAWCLTCQVNERVAFGASEVQQRFEREGILALRADWTARDDTITRALASYGRSGVPVYVLYGRGKREPHVLPEVINASLVLGALDRHL